MLIVQRHERAPGKWLARLRGRSLVVRAPRRYFGAAKARQQLISGMHLRGRLVVHHHQFCFVQVEHLAKLFSDLKLVLSVLRREGLLVSISTLQPIPLALERVPTSRTLTCELPLPPSLRR